MTLDVGHIQAIRHILVALDGSPHSLAALDAAAALAARLQADLEALFVEDDDLFRLADLPCARVTSAVLLEAERIDRERMERQLRLRAERVQALLRRRATALGVQATFRRVRGAVSEQVLAAAAVADLVSLGKAGQMCLDVAGVGSTVKAAMAAGRPLLVLESRPLVGKGLLAACDGSAADVRALAMAAGLARRTRQALHVLVLAEGPARAERLGAQVQTWLAGQEVRPSLSYAWAEPSDAVLEAARRLRPALLVLGLQAGGEGDHERTRRVLERGHCPLLFVP